ncbi:MAG: hypothetical protein RR580_06205, partial [Christensenellaceae bacterium]
DGNIFSIMSRASRLLKQNGQADQAKEMMERVTKSEDYYQALGIISEYVQTELSTTVKNVERKNTKSRRKPQHDR